MNTINKYYWIPILAFILHSCAVKKYIPEGELLYRGGDLIITADSVSHREKKLLTETLEDVLYPEPNSRILGFYPHLHYYYAAQKEHPGFFTRFMNDKIGQKPVYLSDVNVENTKKILENRLENSGFFFSSIEDEVKEYPQKKTAEVDYTIKAGKPYRLATKSFERDTVSPALISDHIETAFAENTFKEEDLFSLKKYKTERERLEDYLKEKGYYYFDDSFLLFQADTNQYKDRKFDLYLKLKDSLPEKVKVPYVLDSVQVYANIINDTVYGVQDTISVKNVDIIQGRGRAVFKPERLRPFILLEPGQFYSPQKSRYTSRRLTSIGNYKFVNIYYAETDTLTDDQGRRHLKSVITLSPLPRNSFQLKLQGVTKSNDFAGPGVGVGYVNRNLFNGGENLNVDLDFGYEKQLSKQEEGTQSLHLGIKTSLLFPRLLFPWSFEKSFRYAIPKTKITAGVDYLDRSQLYSLGSLSSSFGYLWDQNRFVSHGLNLFKVDYVKLSRTSDKFKQILEEKPFLRRSFEQQFIAGLGYTFTFNELNEEQKKGKFYFQFNLDLTGNIPDLFGKERADGTKTFLGLQYAQYAKADIDLSYHQNLSRSGNQRLVGHIFAGYGLPYGNSRSLPFVKQYFSGGPYSIRAFNIRSLGPGSYRPENKENAYFDQAGDIRLEANLEYRFPLFSYFKGAVFADAGNVWLKNNNDELPGGKFSSHFIHELGIGAGFGLRIDIQGFVLRFDLAAPLKRPIEEWKFEYNKPVFNFGIGYPF